MWQVYKMTREYNPKSTYYVAFAFAIPALGGTSFALFGTGTSILLAILWILLALLLGLLSAMIVLGRLAERAAYSQIEGQPGAVGAVLRSSLRRSWRGSEMPVAINPKTQDAVYRATGKGGVVLIGEGPMTRTKRMVDEEQRKIARILPNVPITIFRVGPDEDSIPLRLISKKISKIKSSLTKAEVIAISNRLQSLGATLPIPKGIDPTKVKPGRPR